MSFLICKDLGVSYQKKIGFQDRVTQILIFPRLHLCLADVALFVQHPTQQIKPQLNLS